MKEVSVVWWCPLYGGVRCMVVSVVWWCPLYRGVRCIEVSVVWWCPFSVVWWCPFYFHTLLLFDLFNFFPFAMLYRSALGMYFISCVYV